jgi:CheY-like chemotaxis protein
MNWCGLLRLVFPGSAEGGRMMETEPLSMESFTSIGEPACKVPEQTKSKRTLPAAIVPPESPDSSSEGLRSSPRKAAVLQAEGDGGAVTSATVLFVSDDDYLRSTMRSYLEHVGFQVRSCADAARIPELFFDTPEAGSQVDLLLIDVHTLGLTGLRLAAELTCFQPELPVVVIAPPGMEESDLAGIARLEWKFLSKPVLLPKLLGIIRSTLENKEVQGIVQ